MNEENYEGLRKAVREVCADFPDENLRVPMHNLVGEEGEGFRYIMDGMNAEHVLKLPRSF